VNKWYLNPLKYFSFYGNVVRKSVAIIVSLYIDRLLRIILRFVRLNFNLEWQSSLDYLTQKKNLRM
jgi:hypothetical protein